MCGVALLLIRTDISKRKPIKSAITVIVRPDAGNRKKDDPRNGPDDHEDLDHHAKEHDEKVGIHVVGCSNDFPVIGFEERNRPQPEGATQGGDVLPEQQIGVGSSKCLYFLAGCRIRCNLPSRRSVRSRFIYRFEVWPEERESTELRCEYEAVEDQRCEKGRGRGAPRLVPEI